MFFYVFEKLREIPSISQMAVRARLARPESQEPHLGLTCEWQGPMDLDHHLLLSQVH